MGEIKHTPGPWSAHKTIDAHDGHPECWQIDAEYDAVCTTQFCYAPDTAANARLIAAAPEMKEALESALWTLSVVDGSDLCGGARDLLAMLVSEVESALAKANGEAPQ